MTLRQLIFDTQLKKEDIINKSGITRAYFYKALKGTRKLNEVEIKKLSKAIGISQSKLKQAQS